MDGNRLKEGGNAGREVLVGGWKQELLGKMGILHRKLVRVGARRVNAEARAGFQPREPAREHPGQLLKWKHQTQCDWNTQVLGIGGGELVRDWAAIQQPE